MVFLNLRIIDFDDDVRVGDEEEPHLFVDVRGCHVVLDVHVLKLGLDFDVFEVALAASDVFTLS